MPNPTPEIQLRRAAAEGDIDKVKNFLNKNFINHKSSNGNSALHWSIVNKHYAVTKLLLTVRGIDVDAQNKQGYTPLHLAAKEGDKKTVYRLLKAGAGKKNSIDHAGFSALDYAYRESNSFIVTQLNKKFPQWTLRDADRLAESIYAKFKNNSKLYNPPMFDSKYFFNEKQVKPYFLPANRYSLIDIQNAIENNILDLCKPFVSGNLLQSAAVSRVDTFEKFSWLLKQGVDPNLQGVVEFNPSSYKNTALHTLIANEDEKDAVKFIDLLIKHAKPKFNFNLVDSEGKTCLCLAVKVGLFDVAKKLIGLKVDINRPDEDGNSPLHYAFLLGHTSIVDELLANQANKNAKNKQNQNPYELLISTDIEDVRDCLEIIWINPDRKIKKSKKTYIQQCMENREKIKTQYVSIFSEIKTPTTQKKKIVCFLVAAATGDLKSLQDNCDSFTLNQTNAKGNSALHLACEQGHEEILKFLLEQPEIDIHKENNENKKAAELVRNLFSADLFEEKLLKITLKTEDREDTLSKLNQRKEILSKETIPAVRNN